MNSVFFIIVSSIIVVDLKTIEPHFQSLQGEIWPPKSTIIVNGGRSEINVKGFWNSGSINHKKNKML